MSEILLSKMEIKGAFMYSNFEAVIEAFIFNLKCTIIWTFILFHKCPAFMDRIETYRKGGYIRGSKLYNIALFKKLCNTAWYTVLDLPAGHLFGRGAAGSTETKNPGCL